MLLALSIAKHSGQFAPERVVLRPLLVARGLFGGAALLIFYKTVFLMEIGRASVINLCYVLFATLLAAVFLKERIHRLQLLAMLMSLLGLGLLTGSLWGFTHVSTVDALAVLGAVLAGVAVMLIRQLRHTETSPTIYLSQSFWGLLLCMPLLSFEALFPALPALLLLMLAGLMAGAGQLALTSGFRYLSVAQGAATQLLVPVANTVGGVLLFQERYALLEWLGGVLVLAGCLIVIRHRAGKPRGSDSAPTQSNSDSMSNSASQSDSASQSETASMSDSTSQSDTPLGPQSAVTITRVIRQRKK